MKKLASMFFIMVVMFSLHTPPAFAAGCLSFDLSVQRSEEDLRSLLAVCDAESKETEAQLAKQKAKSSSISSDVILLDSLIKKANQQIAVKNQIIKQLGTQIQGKQATIKTLEGQLSDRKVDLGQIIRQKNQMDNHTLVELFMSGKSVSNFLVDVQDFKRIDQGIQDTMDKLRGIRVKTDQERQILEKQQSEQNDLKKQIEADRQKTQAQQGEKKTLLASSKQQEAEYQKEQANLKSQASKISQALFALRGVDSGGLQFGQAYALAKQAGSATGVRPALILAILKQETNFGSNTGQCYLKDTSTGDGIGVNTGTAKPRTMSPTRDTPIFSAILKTLGMTMEKTRVSCWIPMYNSAGSPMGWGGAMGISQFIPSTWAGYAGGYVGGTYDSSKDRIRSVLRLSSPSNPWIHLHGVTATSLYLKDLGASARTYDAERSAACKYYAGGAGCSSSGGAGYGNSVMNYATQIQKDIDVLENAR